MTMTNLKRKTSKYLQKKFLFLLLPVLALLWTKSVFAVDVITNTVPDIANSQGGAGASAVVNWVQNFYQFSLIAGVFLAVGVITWAGLKYALAAGNPSGQSDARDQILQALLGLLLLFGAYLVLYTVNPNLINLSLPTLKSVPSSAGNSANTNVSIYQCSAGTTFSSLAQCNSGCAGTCSRQTGTNNNNSAPAGGLGSTETGGI